MDPHRSLIRVIRQTHLLLVVVPKMNKSYVRYVIKKKSNRDIPASGANRSIANVRQLPQREREQSKAYKAVLHTYKKQIQSKIHKHQTINCSAFAAT